MKRTIIFIHGMFMTGKSWAPWQPRLEGLGYRCVAADWPLHENEPIRLREEIPPGLGELSLDAVIDRFAGLASQQDQPPILIGHSVGGLIVQILASRGLASAGVCISSVAPNRMLAIDWNFVKNATMISNPLKGNEPFLMTAEGFHATFANTMSRQESDLAYSNYAVHDSRNVLRDCLGEAGKIDLDCPHVPLLFLSGDEDKIIPEKLCQKNADAWSDSGSVTDFREFSGRGHFICGEPGWEEVVSVIANWLTIHAPAASRVGVA